MGKLVLGKKMTLRQDFCICLDFSVNISGNDSAFFPNCLRVLAFPLLGDILLEICNLGDVLLSFSFN